MSNPLDYVSLTDEVKGDALGFIAVMYALAWSGSTPTYRDVDVLWQFDVQYNYGSSTAGRVTFDRHIDVMLSTGIATLDESTGYISLTSMGNQMFNLPVPELSGKTVVELLNDVAQ